MTAWEIWTWNNHPAVIISHPHRAANKRDVELLSCSSQRAARAPGAGEALLDQEDGLDWETIVYCDLILAVEKKDLTNRRGIVVPDRRRAIVRAIIAAHDWHTF